MKLVCEDRQLDSREHWRCMARRKQSNSELEGCGKVAGVRRPSRAGFFVGLGSHCSSDVLEKRCKENAGL